VLFPRLKKISVAGGGNKVTLQSILSGDKSPFIIAIALTIFGWYVNVISSYFKEETIIYLTLDNKTPDTDGYIIKNVSLTKNLENASLQVQCVPFSDCLLSGAVVLIAPFAMVGNQSCFNNPSTYQAQISLTPGASVRINVQKKNGTKTALYFGGHYETPPCNNLQPAQVRIEQSPSAIAFLLENFTLYYFLSIIFLIIVFVITIWRLTFTSTGDQNEGEKNVPQTLNVHLTIIDDSTGGQS
jgi:hypothetical protein